VSRSELLAGQRRWLDGAAVARLERRIEQAWHAARAHERPTLASATFELDDDADPSSIVCASRSDQEHWFCFEQPVRDRTALAALGNAIMLEAEGPSRFTALAGKWRALTQTAIADEPSPQSAPGSGLIAVGGFAFAPAGARARQWRGFNAASLAVPGLSFARRGDSCSMTVNLQVASEDNPARLVARVLERLERLREQPLPLLDPAPVGRYEVQSVMPPAHYEQAVQRAVQRIARGEFDKVVLAREVDVHAPAPHEPAAVFGLLRDAFPTSFVYAVGRGDATFVGATPELLIRRQGQRATTVALAGSARRSADPAVDAHLGEQLLRSDKDREENMIVARRIARVLHPHSVWVTAADEPVVVKVANIQHLAAPIRAQLTSPVDVITLAGLLHPTPAVGAEPVSAIAEIPALEGMDRGWYAGPVGWTDATGDGEFCVALRCALLRGSLGRCYAGCGIVRDSEPAAELAESEIKLQVMLPVLAG
jgi:isochorismate synthase